jgi:hypothetical protein
MAPPTRPLQGKRLLVAPEHLRSALVAACKGER